LQKASTEKSGDTHITVSNETILLLIKFKVRGNLRFLSHAEMLRLFQRACVRAGMRIQYSQGFNPRPKLSLPLPKPVGVESDDDLLCIYLRTQAGSFDCERLKTGLGAQLPPGCELLEVSLAEEKQAPQPRLAEYLFPVSRQYLDKELKTGVERLMARDSLTLQRQTVAKKPKSKDIDVRPFLKSVRFDNKGIVVECKISPSGSIRVDEILHLFELDREKLASPIRRKAVQWQ
jgi:radical SAM-linked protein